MVAVARKVFRSQGIDDYQDYVPVPGTPAGR